MDKNAQLAHRVISNTALPYRSNQSVINTDPCFFTGSSDLLTSVKGIAERRPGFGSTPETTPTTFNNLKRTFTFERNDGNIFTMYCDINSSNKAVVYKYQNGTDTSASAIFTEATASGVPFDFIQSNNTLYFSNGVSVPKKWDPNNGVTNWGISIGGFGGSNNAYAGTGANVTNTGNAWSSPTNVQGAPDSAYATVVLSSSASSTSQGPKNCGTGADININNQPWTNPGNVAVTGQNTTNSIPFLTFSDKLAVTNFGFTIPGTATITGISATFNSSGSDAAIVDGGIFLRRSGADVGSDHSLASAWFNVTTRPYGSSSDLWGTTWTPAQINDSSFGIVIIAQNNDAQSSNTAKVNAFVTITVYYTTSGTPQTSDYLEGTNYGFAIAAANSIQGIQVSVRGHAPAGSGDFMYVALLQGGNIVGATKSVAFNGTSDQTITFGGSADLWSSTWSPSNVNASTFGVAVWCACPSGAAGGTFAIDSAQITVFSVGGPTVSLTGTGLTATVGYQYVVCYGNSNTGHVSSPTAPSAVVKPTNQAIQITLVASTDAQVNQIRVFRTTDSATGLAGQTFYEIPTSPYANSAATPTDSAADTALNNYSLAPTPTFNDPPPAFQGMIYFAGRIWGFIGNKVWFTGLEEIINGVPEESVPSGTAGNFWTFNAPVQGLGVAGSGDSQQLGIFCGGWLYTITGNTLDTFRRQLISQRRGCRSRTNIAMLGGMCAWFDSANQIWVTNGNSLQEISQDIRPDLAGLTHTQCSLTFHTSGNFHWLIFSTGSKLFVYDVDLEQWMPPWNFGCQYIYSGETSPGNYQLIACKTTKALQLSTTAYNDNGVTYQPVIKTNNFSLVPDFGNRFSYIATGMYNEPTRTGYPKYIGVTTNTATKPLADVLFLVDDDITQGTYSSVASQRTTPDIAFNRKQGTFLRQNIYAMNNPVCRWMSVQVKLARADQVDQLHEWFIGYEQLR